VLAGGIGSRMGRPKQFIELLGHPALYHTLRAFEDAPAVDKIYAVGDRGRIEKLTEEAGISKYAGCAEPGEARSLSTRSGLLLCEEEEAIVLIHDGSRCLVTPDLIGRVAEATRGGADGVIPALPVSDTIKVAENGSVSQTLDRAKLHAAQTPQAFHLNLLRRIYATPEKVVRSATDDASLVEDAGGQVAMVVGEKTNIKLTTPEDLILAEAILIAREGAHHDERWGGRWRVW
jgi:2-C-methyl-D-erythritol 4-phosphate cytidylyltransferase